MTQPSPRHFEREDLSGSTFRACDLSGAVMRAVEIGDAEIDAPWLLERMDATLTINGVDVVPLIDAELNKRFPGRELRMATTPAELMAAWEAVCRQWEQVVQQAVAMPAGTLDASVGGEWSLTQTVRHLVLATDMWLGRAILGIEDFHPIGQLEASSGEDERAFDSAAIDFDQVRLIRAERQQRVRDFLAATTPEQLREPRPNPHDPQYQETVHGCLRTIIEEEWEHLRFAVRDLDALRSWLAD